MTRKPHGEPPHAASRRLVLTSLLRAGASVTLLLVVYYVVPLDRALAPTTWIGLGLGLVAFVAIIAWQVRAILASDIPRLRAVQAVAVGFAVLLLLFASVHLRISHEIPDSYTEPLSRTDSLYFTVTVFATVGFGDIAPRTDLARIVTMLQMVMGLVAVGLVARILLGAVRTASSRLEWEGRAGGGVTPNG